MVNEPQLAVRLRARSSLRLPDFVHVENLRFRNLRSRHVGTGMRAIRVAARVLSRLASPQSQRILIKSGVEVYPPKQIIILWVNV